MATILFAWQLGAGSGHLTRMLPLARGFVESGHQVFVAAKHLGRAATIYGQAHVRFLQAPARFEGRLPFAHATNFAHLIGNTGFGDRFELFGLASAWRNLIRLTRPDLIIFDHSPVALLAARGFPCRLATIGTGFCCPIDTQPLPIMRTIRDRNVNHAQIELDEQAILENANHVLELWKQPPLQRLGQFYGEVDECFLTTFKELDHCPERTGMRYWGPVNASGGGAPCWPNGNGPRVFAYLKPFPALDGLLTTLQERKLPVIIHSDGISRTTRKRFECDSLRFTQTRTDPTLAAAECDLAILNGTHGTTCDMLLAGKPILQIPLFIEQEMTADAVSRIGAGASLRPKSTRDQIDALLDQLLCGDNYRQAAGEFARRYADFDPRTQRSEMDERAIELLGRRSRSRSKYPAMTFSNIGVDSSHENQIILDEA